MIEMQEKESRELFNLKKKNNDFEEIFKEMLGIENAKNFGRKVRHCLARVQITNLTEIPEVKTLEDANRILYKVYNFLNKNLKKKDIYLLSDTGCFLVLFLDISIESASNALKKMTLLSGKEFNDELVVSWSIITGTDREEEIKSYTANARLLNDQNGGDTLIDNKKTLLKNDVINIIFKKFLAAFFLFSAFFLTFEMIIFYATGKFINLPGFTMTENFLRNMIPGLFNYFNGQYIKAGAFFLLTSILLLSCLIFGLGMFAGFIINLRVKKADKSVEGFAETEKMSSRRH
jgi:hypothetical protein